MSTGDEAIENAVDELNAVAGELKQLRDKIKQYGDASERLSDVGGLLNKLNDNVGRIHGAFSSALEHVELTHAHARSSKESVEELVGSIPSIVERIEASDAAATAQSLSDAMDSLGIMLLDHKKSLDEVAIRFTAELASQATTIRQLHERVDIGLEALGNLASEVHILRDSTSAGAQALLALNTAFCEDLSPKVTSNQSSLRELSNSVGQLQKDTSRSAESMTGYAGKMLHEMSLLKEQFGSALKTLSEQNETIQRQGALLDEMSKRKKGWFS
ncbi:hypothetical protein MKD38_06130 [Cupriavidus sp. WGlv3]|uniref:hypothetical protein n=1 Tax=Cupriavidus sp. WGlv3 TaxID=2919924 RepID=UPI0020900772|nr:hypothetical protein [Cupriavidus sp. WGlv3]MCO4861243.1 hypothetical protein [Cupriavidus sp. WGlv3]